MLNAPRFRIVVSVSDPYFPQMVPETMAQMKEVDSGPRLQPPYKMLRWAGSKSNVSSQLSPHLLFDRPYIEPFCGSAAFFFERLPASASLNDLNPRLIEAYRSVRDHPRAVWQHYKEFDISEATYYAVRDEFNKIKQSNRRSSMFLYLNHFCFNGIYRTNKSGSFNTPFGGKTKPKKKFEFEDFKYFSKALQNVELHSNDFETFLDKLSPHKSCIYMDPPYFTTEVRVFNEYGAKSFLGGDLERLLLTAQRWANNNLVVVSYKDCAEFRALFGNYVVAPVTVTRNVGGFAGRRKSETELVAVLGS